ncbi:hypothetical protein KP79_PYT23899 [Mizuhopecten yessoensis]|uniref:ZAD domain-containing protein n=1 Tax=Mizuhopecten yessoensis TaxID=6573 RepID=A0A210Q2M1_MIZYE|nr:hypothetical protein KP79_PYT23899 [Mizuhopecten yessoensis]
METCRLCHESLPKKHRRTIFSDTFTVSTQLCEVLGYNVHSNDGMQKYICGYCFTKLNKLSKIEHDIAHRLEALNSERHSLLRELRSKYLKFHADARLPNVSTLNKQEEETCVPSVITPSKQHLKKHKIIHSPTPRKVKTPLTFTPTKMDTSFTTGTSQVPGKRKSINVKLFSPDKVKTIDTLGKLGLSVSSSAASKKKQHLLQRQSEHTEDLLLKEKKALETTEKSDFVILDLLDKSENKSEDMISILELIHEHYIPKTEEDDPSVIKKKFIYQMFYKNNSAAETGTLYLTSVDPMRLFRSTDLPSIAEKSSALDTQMTQINDMFNNEQKRYVCEVCDRKYKTIIGIKTHLKKEHDWAIENDDTNSPMQDHIAVYRASFMKCALLLRNTNDAYKMGDGTRILDNANFQMLLSHVGKHTKYQLWLFRFMAYCLSLLTPRQAYEYIWNCTANIHGNRGHNIRNDNLVEILVQAIKKKVYAQGANATYSSVGNAALTLQVQEEITTNVQKECEKKRSGTKRPEALKVKDVAAIVRELHTAHV